MDLLRLLGFLRDAAGTDVGKDVIDKIRSSIRADAPETNEQLVVDVEALLSEHRAKVERDLDVIREAVRRQNAELATTIRRQRIWNFALTAGIAVTLVMAILAAT